MKRNDRGDGIGMLVGRFMRELHRHDAGRTLPLLHAANLTTPQLAVLEFVRTSRTVSAVADHLGLSRPATSQMVDKLVRAGFVQRVEGAVDRRERSLLLTPKGEHLVEAVAAARARRFETALDGLPAGVLARLEAALAEAIGHLQPADREEEK